MLLISGSWSGLSAISGGHDQLGFSLPGIAIRMSSPHVQALMQPKLNLNLQLLGSRIRMYSRDATVTAVLRFFRSIIRHPYLNANNLILPPPPDGWPSIALSHKNNTVLDLLRHLPYLRPEKQYEELTIQWECIPICYLDLPDYKRQDFEKSYGLPLLPSHCVYLARAGSYMNSSLILDTDTGNVVEYSVMRNDIAVSNEEYEKLLLDERWKVHRATPVEEFFEGWTRRFDALVWMLVPNPIGQPVTGRFYSRAENRREEKLLLRGEELEERSGGEEEREMDEFAKEQRLTWRRQREHVAEIYNTFIRHGWPDHFDKEECREQLSALEKKKDAEERKRMDELNPDAGLFD